MAAHLGVFVWVCGQVCAYECWPRCASERLSEYGDVRLAGVQCWPKWAR